MKSVIASMIAVAGIAVSAHGQAANLRMLVSTDGGATWSSSVNAAPGSHVEVLVTASYTGASALVAGFGSANFQPVVTNWTAADTLSAIGQGGNAAGGMINAQQNSAGIGSPNPYLTGTVSNGSPGQQIGGAGNGYVANTYGRVFPMGRTALTAAANLIEGFVQTIPAQVDQTGRSWTAGTYLRIAQHQVTDWFNAATNTSGGSGVNAAQLYDGGRTGFGNAEPPVGTGDPYFWGNHDLSYVPADHSDPDPANWTSEQFFANAATNGHNERLQNVQLFRFGFDLSSSTTARTLLVDAPLAGQQINSGTTRYLGFYNGSGTSPGLKVNFGTSATNAAIFSGTINVTPSPASLALLGLGGMVVGRRRRA